MQVKYSLTSSDAACSCAGSLSGSTASGNRRAPGLWCSLKAIVSAPTILRADLTELAPHRWLGKRPPTRPFCFFYVQVQVLGLGVGSDGSISRVGLRRLVRCGRDEGDRGGPSVPKGRIAANRNRRRCARCDFAWLAISRFPRTAGIHTRKLGPLWS